MKTLEGTSKAGVVIYLIAFLVSIILMVSGFIIPPTGVIDGSVLSAAGELLGFALVWKIPDIIKAAKTVKVSTPSGTNIEIEGDHKEEEVQ